MNFVVAQAKLAAKNSWSKGSFRCIFNQKSLKIHTNSKQSFLAFYGVRCSQQYNSNLILLRSFSTSPKPPENETNSDKSSKEANSKDADADDKPKFDEEHVKPQHKTTTEAECSYNEDIQLQNTFNSIFGRLGIMFRAIWGADFDKYAAAYNKLSQQKTLSLDLEHYFLIALNPLLVKYKFDIAEFAEGVTIAFPAVKEAASLVLDASVYPENYTSQAHEIDEKRHFLNEIFGDKMLKSTQISSKQLNFFKEMKIKFDPHRHAHLVVETVTLEGVRTRVVEPDDSCAHQETMKGPVVELTEQMDPHMHQKSRKKSKEELQRAEDLRRYRPGAVIASVDVRIDAEADIADGENHNHKKMRISEVWRFEGCISGHVPLNWLVVASYPLSAHPV